MILCLYASSYFKLFRLFQDSRLTAKLDGFFFVFIRAPDFWNNLPDFWNNLRPPNICICADFFVPLYQKREDSRLVEVPR